MDSTNIIQCKQKKRERDRWKIFASNGTKRIWHEYVTTAINEQKKKKNVKKKESKSDENKHICPKIYSLYSILIINSRKGEREKSSDINYLCHI